MKVSLFIPCYVDTLFPEVGIATLELLEKFGVEVEFPKEQTCCGQPMSNEGDYKHTQKTEAHFCKVFDDSDIIVCPSGSCVNHVRNHMGFIDQTSNVEHIRTNTFEIVEFLHKNFGDQDFPWAEFPHKVAVHNSCSNIRGLHVRDMTEWMMPRFDQTKELLKKVKGISIADFEREDECCGFGGTFCVTDPGISASMASDKLNNVNKQQVDYLVSPDSSCMMHLHGVAAKSKMPLKFVHLTQVLNNGPFRN